MKSLLLPETNDFRILAQLGSMLIFLALLIALAWVGVVVWMALGETSVMGLRSAVFLLALPFYILPVLIGGLLLRWTVALLEAVHENNRLLQRINEASEQANA